MPKPRPHAPPLSDLLPSAIPVLEAVLPSFPGYDQALVSRMVVSSSYAPLTLDRSDPRAFREALAAQRLTHDRLLDQTRSAKMRRLGPVSWSTLDMATMYRLAALPESSLTTDQLASLGEDTRVVAAHVIAIPRDVQVELQRKGWRWPTTAEIDRALSAAADHAARSLLDLASRDGHPEDPPTATSSEGGPTGPADE